MYTLENTAAHKAEQPLQLTSSQWSQITNLGLVAPLRIGTSGVDI